MATNKEFLQSFGVTEDDAEKMVSDAVFFLLVSDQKKSIIKRPDLIKQCDLAKKDKKLQDYVVQKARNVMADTFGIEVADLSKPNQYILTNKLTENSNVSDLLDWSDKEASQMAVIFITLGLILMMNDKVTDEVLFKFYKQLGLYEDEKQQRTGKSAASAVDPEVTELFDGDLKKFVNETLVARQHYLKRERVNTGDAEQEVYEYSWGERAEKEVKMSSVFKFVCEVYECEPTMFREVLDRVKKREDLDDDYFSNGS